MIQKIRYILDDGTFIACSEDGNLCVMSNSERAQCNFSMSYCLLNGSLERTCEEDILEWTGSIPFLLHGKNCPHTAYTLILVEHLYKKSSLCMQTIQYKHACIIIHIIVQFQFHVLQNYICIL